MPTTPTQRRPRTHVSEWAPRTVTTTTLEQWEAEWRTNRPPLPADLTGIADDDLAAAIRMYADRPDHVVRAYTTLEQREREAAERAALRQVRIDALTAAGWDYLTAVADANGVDVNQLRVQAAVAASGRRAGESDRQALRRQYDEWTDARVLQAETDCRGHLLNAAGRTAGVDPARLFSGPLWLARRWASSDLLGWWERHGRVTFTEFRAMATGAGGAR